MVVLITGAGSGIGQAAAVRFAHAGDELLLVGRTEATLRQTQQRVRRAEIFVADVSKPEAAEPLIDATLTRFGRLDAIVHCAGEAPMKSVQETTPELWRATLEVNLSSAWYLARAAWPLFTRQRGGVIINLSSLAARDPFSGFFAYGAAKAALVNLGLTLAREGRPHGIRVHTLAPGMTDTPMFRAVMGDKHVPPEDVMSPAEVAETIYACVAGGLSHTSGETIYLRR